ncbi:MAG: hypothetical protein QXU18_08690 [Thermoplasmatales archaeon]
MMVLIRDEDILYEVRKVMSIMVALGIASGQEDAWNIVKKLLHDSLNLKFNELEILSDEHPENIGIGD